MTALILFVLGIRSPKQIGDANIRFLSIAVPDTGKLIWIRDKSFCDEPMNTLWHSATEVYPKISLGVSSRLQDGKAISKSTDGSIAEDHAVARNDVAWMTIDESKLDRVAVFQWNMVD